MASELKDVFEYICPRVLEYVEEAERPDSKVGKRVLPQELLEEVESLQLGQEGHGLEGLKTSTEFLLENSVATWSNRFLEKLYAGNEPVGVASDLLLSVLNTNAHVFTASPAFSVIERFVSKKYADVFGLTGPNSGGLTFPGGAYSNLTAMQVARSTLYPETKEEGQNKKLAVYTSEHAHYSVRQATIVMGLGDSSLFKIPVDKDGCMNVKKLENEILRSKSLGYTPFFINATAGTTVYGSFDDFESIARIAANHSAWFHIDASWGGNFAFSQKLAYRMKGSHRADSLVVNPHKMLGVPCTCSFLLVPDFNILRKANSLQAGYLFHSDDESSFDLADGTLGCGRRPDAVKLFLAWQYHGSNGFAKRVERASDLAKYLYTKVASSEHLIPLDCGEPQCLQVCFWFGKDKKLGSVEETSTTTRHIVKTLHANQQFLVDYSTHERGEMFRVVLNSPKVTKDLVDELVLAVQEVGIRKLEG